MAMASLSTRVRRFPQASHRARKEGICVQYLIVYLADPIRLLRRRLRANKMLSSSVQQAPSVACGGGRTFYEQRPRSASAGRNIHAGCMYLAFVVMEESLSLWRSGWLTIRSGGCADLAFPHCLRFCCATYVGPRRESLGGTSHYIVCDRSYDRDTSFASLADVSTNQ